jgi:hypothetical protein
MGSLKPHRAGHLVWSLATCLAFACTGGAPAEETCPEPCDGSATDPTLTPTTTPDTETPDTATSDTTTPTLVTDEFVQAAHDSVDVLFVVDNSCSMAVVQDELAANGPWLFDYLVGSGIDFHIGVTSTDLDRNTNGSNGTLHSVAGVDYIDSLTPSPELVFASMVRMGTSGSATEQGLGAAYTALEVNGDTVNAGFLRDDSALSIVVVSDEQDHTASALITVPEFTNWLGGLAPDRPSVGFDAIVTQTGGDAGTVYMDVAASVGGAAFDIATPDYAPVLDALGLVASGLQTEFCPSTPQDPENVEVTVEVASALLQFEFPDDFEGTAGGCIRFLDYVPSAGAIIRITYTS